MSLIIEHLEYLMQRHDCVTVPGIGALMARTIPARFDKNNKLRLLPPTRVLAFNALLADADGLLERSVSRRSGVSFDAARRIVKEEADSLRSQLKEFGQLTLGRLGVLTVGNGNTINFEGFPTDGWDFRFYGLQPLVLTECYNEEVTSKVIEPISPYSAVEEGGESDGRSSLARRLIGVAASLAVIVTLALFLLNPIRVSNEPVKASIAPTENVVKTISPKADAPSVVTSTADSVSDSIKPTVVEEKKDAVAQPVASNGLRFVDSDRYCLIVASFPDEQQAKRYIAANSPRRLGVLNKEGKYRVYSATATTRTDAENLRLRCGQADAWICSR